jgi:hypothetical protein
MEPANKVIGNSEQAERYKGLEINNTAQDARERRERIVKKIATLGTAYSILLRLSSFPTLPLITNYHSHMWVKFCHSDFMLTTSAIGSTRDERSSWSSLTWSRMHDKIGGIGPFGSTVLEVTGSLTS